MPTDCKDKRESIVIFHLGFKRTMLDEEGKAHKVLQCYDKWRKWQRGKTHYQMMSNQKMKRYPAEPHIDWYFSEHHSAYQ